MSELRCKQLSKARLATDFSLDFSISQTGVVTVPIAWESSNLVRIKLPIPTGITTGIRLHKRAAPVFEAWFRLWTPEACKALKTFNGSFVPRLMRLSKNLPKTDSPTRDWAPYLSRHSRGVAIDLNAEWNKQGKQPAAADELGTLMPMIELLPQVRVPMTSPDGTKWEAGLVWGGHWSGAHVDGMHLELGSF